MADIPGIIEGASEGKGLGLRFLRHIERNSLLLFVIPADADDIKKNNEVLLNELTQYNPELLDKRRVLAISKSDMLDDELIHEMSFFVAGRYSLRFYFIRHRLRISALKDLLWRELNADDMVSQFSVSRDSIVHRKLDVRSLHFDEDEEDVSDGFDDDLYDESEDDEDDADYFEEDF